MVNFVLEALSSTVTLGVAGSILSEIIPDLDASAVAVLEVSLDAMKSVFKYQTESLDVDNADATDIKYYVDPSFWPALNPANASLTHELATGRIAEVDSAINPIPCQQTNGLPRFCQILGPYAFQYSLWCRFVPKRI